MERKRGLVEFQSSYGYDEEEDASDEEEWQSTPLSVTNCSRQAAISLLPPSKKPRIDSATTSSPGKIKTAPGKGTFQQPDCSLRHDRTIIHVDIDCFYAQVEMIRNPNLRNVPLGIQQKHIVVTCNYIAREQGVTKLSFITDAKKKCPDLVLVNGEDLTVYREFSGKVHSLLTQEFTPLVERLGMDENFLDVTDLVNTRLQNHTNETRSFVGAVYGTNSDENEIKMVNTCHCGCHESLKMGSVIAAEVRQAILNQVGLTCCAGIAHNKLLAKLVGGWKKPNMQSTLLPKDAENLLLGLRAKDIPGIGHSTAKKLQAMNVLSVTDLLSCPSQVLEREFGNLQTALMTKLCHGIDDSLVTPSGEFKSITDEDSFKKCSTLEDARKRLACLVEGLLPRVSSDRGAPETIKVTVRHHVDKSYKRESRQCRLPHVCFDDQIKARETLLMTCLKLFQKLVDVKKTFHLTLLGVSLLNFQKSPFAKSKNISNFFQKSFPNGNDSVSLISSPSTSTSCEVVELLHSDKISLSGHGVDKNVDHIGQVTGGTPIRKENELIVCPKGIDPQVFLELPLDVQKELKAQYTQQSKERQPKNSVTLEAKKCPAGILKSFVGDSSIKLTSKAKTCCGIQKYFVKDRT